MPSGMARVRNAPVAPSGTREVHPAARAGSTRAARGWTSQRGSQLALVAVHHDAALPDDLPLLHQPERILESLDGVLGAHVWLELALAGQLQQAGHGLAADLRGDAELRPHPHADQVEALDQRHVHRERGYRPGGEPYDEKPCTALRRDAADTLVEDLASDRLVDHVAERALRDFPNDVFQILLAVVHYEVGPDLLASLELVVRAGRCDHLRSQGLAELDCHDAHAASSACHQQPLAGLELAALCEGVVSGSVPHVKSCALAECETRRQREAHALGQHHLLGSAAPHGREEDPVAGAQALRPRAGLDDHAGALGAHHERQLRLVLVLVLQHQQLREIQRCRVHLNSHLAALQALLPGQILQRGGLDALCSGG
mmetsp:Transcript_41830/g.116536  ORF Transcript_41830/g.116536 Transcript_41830/m.116536 type:complete len:372 (+) Transcript_41830:77-1192(+)